MTSVSGGLIGSAGPYIKCTEIRAKNKKNETDTISLNNINMLADTFYSIHLTNKEYIFIVYKLFLQYNSTIHFIYLIF